MNAMMQRFSLQGKTALVTGASRGIGKALAIGLAEAGAKVLLTSRKRAVLESVAQEIVALGGEAAVYPADITDSASRKALFAEIQRKETLDILINNAGYEEICASLEVDEALWERVLGTNLKAAFFCAQAAARLMPKGSAMVNLCSLASAVGIPQSAAYGASKSGLLGITRALSSEWAAQGIRVNAIGPGYFHTEMTEVFYQNPQWRKTMLSKIPAGRFGEGEDLQGAVIFLCSPAASYISGQVLYIDGGYLASI